MKKRIIISIIAAWFVGLLTGCSAEIRDAYIEQVKESLIQDASVIDILKDVENKIGQYQQTQNITDEAEKGIQVVFADNSNLSIEYYYDKDCKNIINKNDCYLNVNDCIYYGTPDIKSIYGESLYSFTGHKVVAFDEHGENVKLSNDEWKIQEDTNIAYQIPSDFRGKMIVLYPYGALKNIEMNVSDYILEPDNSETPFWGNWKVNGEKIGKKDNAIKPSESVTVEYDCGKTGYFVVSTDPVGEKICETRVVFRDTDRISDEQIAYKILVHPYIDTTITFDEDVEYEYRVSEGRFISGKSNSISVDNCVFGDVIEIHTKKKTSLKYDENKSQYLSKYDETTSTGEYPYIYNIIVDRDYKTNLSISVNANVGDGALAIKTIDDSYSVVSSDTRNVSLTNGVIVSAPNTNLGFDEVLRIVVEKTDTKNEVSLETKYITSTSNRSIDILSGNNSQIYKNIKLYIERIRAYEHTPEKIENGTISYKLSNGKSIISGDIVDDKEMITITIKPDKDYYISNKGKQYYLYSESMEYGLYKKEESNIKNRVEFKKYIHLRLDQNDKYGICEYYLNGKLEKRTSELVLRDDDELELKYTITNDDYQISSDQFGVFENFGAGAAQYGTDGLNTVIGGLNTVWQGANNLFNPQNNWGKIDEVDNSNILNTITKPVEIRMFNGKVVHASYFDGAEGADCLVKIEKRNK